MQHNKSLAIDHHTREAGDFDALYRRFEQDAYSSTFTYGRKKIEELIDREIAGIPLGTRVLDVGCGTGFNLVRLRRRGFSVVGLEPSPEMRRLAEDNNPGVEIVAGDAEALPWPDGSFDLVLSIEVIRYLEGPDKALAEMARVLRPGGVAIVTAAPLLSLNGYALINAVTSRVTIPTFGNLRQSFLTVAQARRSAQRAGFSHVMVHSAFIGPWHVLGRLSSRALSVALRAFEPIDERLADHRLTRDLSNHLIVVARR